MHKCSSCGQERPELLAGGICRECNTKKTFTAEYMATIMVNGRFVAPKYTVVLANLAAEGNMEATRHLQDYMMRKACGNAVGPAGRILLNRLILTDENEDTVDGQYKAHDMESSVEALLDARKIVEAAEEAVLRAWHDEIHTDPLFANASSEYRKAMVSSCIARYNISKEKAKNATHGNS